jgi:hypothetical protein
MPTSLGLLANRICFLPPTLIWDDRVKPRGGGCPLERRRRRSRRLFRRLITLIFADRAWGPPSWS